MKVETIIKAKQLIGGKEFSIIDDPIIGIKKGIIVFIDSHTTRHNAERVIDLSHAFLLPGFIDTHVHFIFGGTNRSYEEVMDKDSNEIMLLRASQNALCHLKKGVTTARDLADRDGVMLSYKEAVNRGIVKGPRMVVSGPPLTITGGHFHFCHGEVNTEDEIRKTIRIFYKKGVDVIKVMASGGTTQGSVRRQPTFSKKDLVIIVSESHKLGLPTSAHVHCTAAIENCVEAGIDCLEHVGFYDFKGDTKIDLGIIKKMVQRGTYACVTLKNSFLRIKRLKEEKDEASLKQRKEFEKELRNRIDTLKICYENNVRLVAGTDSIWEFGDFSLILKIMVDAGIPAMEVLRIATLESAKALVMEDKIGSIEPGKYADIIAFKENPVINIESARDPLFVMKGGERIV